MATIFSITTSSSPKIKYTVSVSELSRTPTACTVRYTISGSIASSSGKLLTGHRIVVYIHGASRELKSSSATWNGHGKGNTVSVDVTFGASAGTTTVSGVSFSATNTYGNAGDLSAHTCSSYGISSATSRFGSISMSGSAVDQTKARATVSGMPNVGYGTSIRWYLGDKHIATTSRGAWTSTGSYTQEFTGLLPNTAYTLKAVAYGDSTAMTTKTVTVTTPQETGELAVTAQATYLKADVSGMFDAPNYTRSIEVYYKKSSENDYKLFKTVKEQGAKTSVNVTGLISNVKYDIKCLIKNGSTTLKTLTKTGIFTLKDTSLIPTPQISEITQKLGTRECTLTWIADKDVVGTTYKIEAKTDGESSWTTLATLKSIESPKMVIAHAGNANVKFRISAENSDVAAAIINYSAERLFYVRDDFVWDTDKVSGGQLKISANEWNRLREYAISRNRDIGNDVNIPVVTSGDRITAETYNVMKSAISLVNNVGVSDKASGDMIRASDIDALRVAINKTA